MPTPIDQLPITDTFDPDTDTLLGTVYTDGTPFTMQIPSNLIGAVTSIIAGTGISVDQSTGNVTISASGGGGFTATKCVSVWESSWSNGNPVSATFSLSESGYDINTDYITVNIGDDNITFVQTGLYSIQYQWTIQSHFTDDYRWDWDRADGSVTITANSEITETASYFISTSTQAFSADDIYTPSASLETYSGNDVATGSAQLTLTVEYLGPQPD